MHALFALIVAYVIKVPVRLMLEFLCNNSYMYCPKSQDLVVGHVGFCCSACRDGLWVGRSTNEGELAVQCIQCTIFSWPYPGGHACARHVFASFPPYFSGCLRRHRLRAIFGRTTGTTYMYIVRSTPVHQRHLVFANVPSASQKVAPSQGEGVLVVNRDRWAERENRYACHS